MGKIIELMGWFKEITRYPHDTHKFIQVVEHEGIGNPTNPDENCERVVVYIYTDSHCYSIVAIDNFERDGYLGCQASTRKPNAGEDWVRGNDLPDGPFNRETWQKIKDAIIGYELVELSVSEPCCSGVSDSSCTRCSAEAVITEKPAEACSIDSKDCKT
jgi:hypothetical protein